MLRQRSGESEWKKSIESILASHSKHPAWITDEGGNILMANKKSGNISFEQVPDFLEKHKIKIDLLFPNPFEFSFLTENSLEQKNQTLLSASKITIQDHSFYLFVDLNTQKEPQFSSDEMLATDLGIYFWQLSFSENSFQLSHEAWKNLFGIQTQSPGYEDFYSCLSLESIQKFSQLMEEAINYGKSFSTELLIDLPGGYKWIWFSCAASEKNKDVILNGIIKDLTREKKAEAELANLNLWLNSGLARFKVEGADGQVIKDWTGPKNGKNIEIEGLQRKTSLFDFRNNIKYRISAFLGDEIEKAIDHNATTTKEVLSVQSNYDSNPVSIQGTQEQKFIKITQWLGQSLDAQVSAIGIFKANQFEWKAWWKSPTRAQMVAANFKGEWKPPLNWLEEIEHDKESQAIWWPQDMLPFSIEKNFGDGWMLLTDTISPDETTLFAVKSDDPASLLEKTQHVIKGIGLLKPKLDPTLEETEVEKLKRQLREKELLLKELNHRAKNNLSIASGLVKMQAGYSESEECNQLLRQTQKRLETLATVHEQLYSGRETSNKLDMKEFLTRIINGLVGAFSGDIIHLDLNIDPIWLDLKKANTVGLLVNELISNSFKHAFSESKGGELKVDFLEKGDFYKLRVSDSGPGINPKVENGESLGKMLIHEFVLQLNGTMEIVTPPGTTYLITFAK